MFCRITYEWSVGKNCCFWSNVRCVHGIIQPITRLLLLKVVASTQAIALEITREFEPLCGIQITICLVICIPFSESLLHQTWQRQTR